MKTTEVRDIKPLTGIRFIAAMAVVLLHLREKIVAINPATLAWTEPVIYDVGKTAVPFFFVLSGFILAHVYFPAFELRNHGRFVWLRFARLWPVHAAMFLPLLAYVAALALAKGHEASAKFDFGKLLPDLTMFRGWYDSDMAWNFPAWSIQAEWFAYLVVFPLCGLVIRPLRNPWVLGAIVAACFMAHPVAHDAMPAHTGKILCLFVAGAALQRLHVVLPGRLGWMAVVGVALYAVAMVAGKKTVAFASFGLIILGLAYEQGWLSRFLSHRWLVYGGQISFALYMSHFVVNVWVREVCKQARVEGLPLVVISIVAALLVAAAVHHFVEAPANRRLRRMGTGGRTQ